MKVFSGVFWTLVPFSLAIQVHAQCRDISSENQRALTIGQQVCFRCPLQGSNFTWRYLESTILPSGTQAVANGTLVISSVAQVHLDPNFFTCQAEGGPVSEPYRLIEASIPPPLLFDKMVNELTDVTVFCSSSARPTPHIYEWTYKGMRVSGNSVLQLSRVQRTQAGVYTCTTTNIVGNASATLTLTVQFAPANTLVSDPVVVHQINHTLSCSFDGLPHPTVTWRFNGTTFVTGSDNYVIRESGSMSHVDIVGTKLGNSGEYECEVSNPLGTDSDTVFLTVQVPPFAPTDLSVGAITTTGFQLMWTNPFDGNSPLTEATITLSSTDGSNSFPADTLTAHQFQGLIPNRQYQIEVVVSNAIGSSPPGNVSAMTLPLGLHNDTVRGDPLFSIPLPSKYITDPELKSVQLCFEVHGQSGNHYSLISDRCTSVTALYSAGVVDTAMHVITKIGVKTQGTSGACHSVKVDLDNCSASLDGAYINESTTASVDGVRVRVRRSRIRVSVPNCEASKRIVMWVTCTRRSSESLLEVVVARGDGLEPTAHGVIGQFWNIPLKIEPYVGQYGEGRVDIMDKFYSVTVSYPNTPERTFIAEYDKRDWFDNRPCLYAGNGDGGHTSEVPGSDSVIEGTACSYVVRDLFSTDFEFSKYNRDC